MRLTERRRNAIGVCGMVLVMLLMVAVPSCIAYRREQQSKADNEDAAALRSVIAEAYVNINDDPEFVNTATEDQPMEIPEKYYTYVESVQGDGRVYVFVNVDGSVDAYFGSPERVIGYYADLAG